MKTETNEPNVQEKNSNGLPLVNVFDEASTTSRNELHSYGFAARSVNKSRKVFGRKIPWPSYGVIPDFSKTGGNT
jgi:hypothetical protein